MIHFVGSTVSDEDAKNFYALGENSYFSESAYKMDDWKNRYWGSDNYEALLDVKKRYDPDGIFWCRHCVNLEEADSSLSTGAIVGIVIGGIILLIAFGMLIMMSFNRKRLYKELKEAA